MVTEDLRTQASGAFRNPLGNDSRKVIDLIRVQFAQLYSDCLATTDAPIHEIEELESVIEVCLHGLSQSDMNAPWERQAIERLRFYQTVFRLLRSEGVSAAKKVVEQSVKALRKDKFDFGLPRAPR